MENNIKLKKVKMSHLIENWPSHMSSECAKEMYK